MYTARVLPPSPSRESSAVMSQAPALTTDPLPLWLRVLVRVDFVVAVAGTVIAPLVLLAGALRAARKAELVALLRYWRASSLLMVTVYLLIGERRLAFPAGVAARLLIARTLRGEQTNADPNSWYEPWRRLVGGYCLAGAALTTPMLQGLIADELPLLCRAYIEPTQVFAALLHPGVPRETLGRVGLVGLGLFLAGAAAAQLAWARSPSLKSGRPALE